VTSIASLPPPQDETSLGDVVPLGDFLWSLRQRGIAVGLRDYRAVERLLLRWPSTDRTLLRDAVASIVARGEQELADVRAAYDEWFEEKEAAVPPPPPATIRVPRARAFLVVLVIVFAAVSTIGAFKVWQWKHQPTPSAIHQQPPTAPATTAAPPPPPLLPPARRGNSLRIATTAAVIAILLVLSGAAVWQMRKRRARWKKSYLSETLAGMTGPGRYEQVVKRAEPLIDRTWVEDVATIIGRGVEAEEQSDHIDIEQSLRLTLRAGMRPQLVFEPPPRNAALLILQDTSAEMRPWREKIDAFVAELVRQRVIIERWFFDSDPSIVWSESFGRRVTIERLSGQRGQLSLLVISSGDAAGQLDQLASAGLVLRRWAYRAWLNPVANPAYWPAALWHLPIHVWPFTRGGLRGMAWDLAHTSLAAPNELTDAPRPVSADDIERMKRLIALVPSPTLALADELRRRYASDVPEEVVLFLAAEGAFRGERYSLPKEEIVRLLAAERTDAPSRERRIRQFLLEVLRDSEPAEGSVAHMRWQLDLAVQQMQAAATGDGSQAEPLSLLGTLAEGPLREEVEAAVGTMRAAPAMQSAVRRTLCDAASRLPSVVPESVQTLPPRLAWPGWAAVPIAAMIAACSFVAARPAGRGTGDILPHKFPYQLTDAGNGVYRLTSLGRAPRSAAIYADEKRLTDVTVPASVVTTAAGVYLQARAELGTGQLALSNLVWVPKRIVPHVFPPPEVKPPVDVISNVLKDPRPTEQHAAASNVNMLTKTLPGILHIDAEPALPAGLPAGLGRLTVLAAAITVRDAANRQIGWNGSDLTLPAGRYSVTSEVSGVVLASAAARIEAGQKTSVAIKPTRGIVSISVTSNAASTMRLKTPRKDAQLVESAPGHYDLFAPGGTYDVNVNIAGYVPSTVPVTVVNGASHQEMLAPDTLFEASSASLDAVAMTSVKKTYKVEERVAFEFVRPDGSVSFFRKIDGRDAWRERKSGGDQVSNVLEWGGPLRVEKADGMLLKGTSEELFIPNRVTPAGSGVDDKSVYLRISGAWQPFGRIRDVDAK
jgi:hypothetical protein